MEDVGEVKAAADSLGATAHEREQIYKRRRGEYETTDSNVLLEQQRSEQLSRAREQQNKFMKVVEARDSRIAHLEKMIETHEQTNKSLKEENASLSVEVGRLNDDIFNLAQSSERSIDEKRKIKTLELQLEVEQTAQKQSEIRLAKSLQDLAEERAKRNEADKQALTLQKQLLQTPSPVADLELHVKHLQKELESQSMEITKARTIKGRLESEQVLKEKLAQAVARAERAENALASTSETKVEDVNGAGQRELETWRSAMREKFGAEAANPYEIVRKFSELEKSNLQLTEECGSFRIKSGQALQSQDEVERRHETLLQEAKSLRDTVSEMKLTALRHERKITLLQKERDGLKRIIASYDDEELSLKPSEATTATATTDPIHALRVKELEGVLSQERSQVAKLESELQMTTQKLTDASSRAETLQLTLSELQSSLRKLESDKMLMSRELDASAQELSQLKTRQDTRVLHFVNNPEEQARKDHLSSKIEILEAENSALKSEIQKIEKSVKSSTSSSASLAEKSGRDAAAVAEANIVVLQKQLEVLSKKESRLKSAFQERVSVFRDACYSIFGYRIDMTTEAANNKSVTTFILRPMHEEQESLYLAFRYNKSGQAELVPTTYSETMQREVDTFIGRYKSIPAFTANLTMDIFNKQTQC